MRKTPIRHWRVSPTQFLPPRLAWFLDLEGITGLLGPGRGSLNPESVNPPVTPLATALHAVEENKLVLNQTVSKTLLLLLCWL